MKNDSDLELVLDLPEVIIDKIEKNATYKQFTDCIIIHLSSVNRHYNYLGTDLYDIKDSDVITVRDLSISGKPVFLKINKRRFFANGIETNNSVSEVFRFITGSNQFTIRYELYILGKIISGITHDQIARDEKISPFKIRKIEKYYGGKIIDDFMKNKRGINFPIYLSIDEISAKKGHRDFYTIIYDLKDGSVITILKGRKKEDIEDFFKNELTDEEKNRVKHITMDMSKGYKNIAELYFPNAEIIIDRFHVTKELNKRLDEIRKNVNKDLSDDERKNLKGNRFVLLKNFDNTLPDEKLRLAGILTDSKLSDIIKAYELKEGFQRIMNYNYSVETAIVLIDWWIERVEESGLEIIQKFVKTLKNWYDYILNYFKERLTNAVAEGINNKIKAIKRQAYGFTNIDSFRRRVMLSFV